MQPESTDQLKNHLKGEKTIKKNCLLLFLCSISFTVWGQSADAAMIYASGGLFYNTHSPESFDGESYYVGSNQSFYAPEWSAAPGFYAGLGFAISFSSEKSRSWMFWDLAYERAVHDGSHTDGDFTGVFNDVIGSISYCPMEIKGRFFPLATAGMSWGWLSIKDGVVVGGTDIEDTTFMGMGFHVGGGLLVKLSNLFILESSAGYRIQDYVDASYSGFSSSVSANGNGLYVKLGIRYVFLSENL